LVRTPTRERCKGDEEKQYLKKRTYKFL